MFCNKNLILLILILFNYLHIFQNFTCETSSIIIEDIIKLSDFLVRCWERIIRISGMHGRMSKIQEQRPTRVMIANQSYRLFRKNIRGIFTVQVPCRFHTPPHVQTAIRLHKIFKTKYFAMLNNESHVLLPTTNVMQI